jgi:transcription termination factor Rho
MSENQTGIEETDDQHPSGAQVLGVLELMANGAGFIRNPANSYLPGDGDTYVPPKLVQRHGLRTGDEVEGEAGPPPGRGKNPPLMRVTAVNGRPPEALHRRPDFQRLGAQHPNEQLVLECGLEQRGQPDMTNRIIDLFCPFGKGQRALIVAPAKAGKTTVLQAVAAGIVKNYPNSTLFILLVDERPEEVTEMEMFGMGEVISSSFDHPADRHVSVAEMTLERARRRVELGEDVVIILDSITRLARAYNTTERSSGKTLSGGLDAGSLEKPKRFLGSARKIDPAIGGGSLTIIATALIDTGSRMDEVIFEEFKGTGNSELVLSRELSDRRIFPAIDMNASATRREELLLGEKALRVSHMLRRDLSDMSASDAMSSLISQLKRNETNEQFIDRMLGVAPARR